MVVDGDTGGLEHFAINIKAMRQGVSAVIIEDKKILKKFAIRKQGKTRTRRC